MKTLMSTRDSTGNRNSYRSAGIFDEELLLSVCQLWEEENEYLCAEQKSLTIESEPDRSIISPSARSPVS
jgi:hypothetical protein